ncbi:MAG: DeoR/GlpR family DNA-binding transcription regulator [Candidatus Humimicrobiaceae bacterium]
MLDLLSKKPNITVDELSQMYQKSIPTIYKDLKILERDRHLKKVYGGVRIFNPEIEKGFYDYYKRVEEKKEIKRALAKEAVKLISDGDIVAIDASTTCSYIINELKNENNKNITIVTNSIIFTRDEVFLNKENIKIFITGGILEKKTACFLEVKPKTLFPGLIANKFFFSTFGFSLEYGVMDSFLPQNCAVKRDFFEMCQASFCLIDSDKFNINGVLNWAGLKEIKTIITDGNIDNKIIKYLSDKDIKVIIAKL